MKKIIAILFLLLYFNIAFPISFDCEYCCGKLVSVKFHGSGNHHSPGKNCCETNTVYCKVEDQKNIVTGISSSSVSDCIKEKPAHEAAATINFSAYKDFNYYACNSCKSSREILSFIQSLRI